MVLTEKLDFDFLSYEGYKYSFNGELSKLCKRLNLPYMVWDRTDRSNKRDIVIINGETIIKYFQDYYSTINWIESKG